MLTKVLNCWIQVSDVQLSFGLSSHCKIEGETVDGHLLEMGCDELIKCRRMISR